MRLIRAVALSLACVCTIGFAQTGDGLYGNTFTVTDLGNGVHTLMWIQKPGTFAIGNSTFIVGERDVIVVDSGFSRATGQAILEGLKTVTGKPVSTVINTRWHADHIFGNQVFRTAFPSARFVAHPETRSGIITGELEYRDLNRPKMQARLDELKTKANRTAAEDQELRRADMQIESWQGDYVLPDVLVDQTLTIMQGTREVRVMHLGAGNTKGDLVVHLPAERIVISGDMAITPMAIRLLLLASQVDRDPRSVGRHRRGDNCSRSWTDPERSAVPEPSSVDAAIGGGTGRFGREGRSDSGGTSA